MTFRFAHIHARVAEPMTAAVERLAEERGIVMPVDARSLERLTVRSLRRAATAGC